MTFEAHIINCPAEATGTVSAPDDALVHAANSTAGSNGARLAKD
ncbi:MAG: hypothetical protein ACLP0J_22895 [Solirubrobacteraceae bacterium]|jgi:hypothetical protein